MKKILALLFLILLISSDLTVFAAAYRNYPPHGYRPHSRPVRHTGHTRIVVVSNHYVKPANYNTGTGFDYKTPTSLNYKTTGHVRYK